ncbi:succinate-semialdehyde dehydrogenase [Sporothrix schenckii 1099-18]|uniref:Succinate-semialdehyde dehydrogenase n=1 Tax=Sporothrix schenckii 1099-18 TaxID=1397361 RepID=A0A0F2MEG6_SPOSC|nr:succinate-semialdehyde dehydrogenase [Sporothrix schenckii 1099-18]KJR87255.1 succinate-semialdehyde dehydrogenase [Sporothrix schenckii 1099-18]
MTSTALPFTLNDPDLLHTDNFVNGQWTSAASGRRFDVIDPGSGKPWASCPDSAPADVEDTVQTAHAAFLEYSKWTPRKRAQTLGAWHQLIVAARDDLARILVLETGKPLAEAYGEIDYGTTFTWWFTGEADRIQGATLNSALPGRRGLVIKQPIGTAVALVPWNFPLALVLRKAGAALAAGCTMVVKTSPETPVTAFCLAHLARRAGFPPGALNVLSTTLDNTPAVAEALCLHPLVKKVTFTGSTRVGKIISGLCARNLKKCTLELGGNCPFIVFDDASLDQAVAQLQSLKWRHAGQACVSANRVYVQRGIHDAFVARIVTDTQKLKLGHGLAEGTTLGPVTTPRGLDKGEELFQDAVQGGAKVVLGRGCRETAGDGYFMAPTVLTGIHDGMAMAQDEVFAPILGISVFDTEEEAVQRANNTSMGLASYVFSKNVDRLWRMFENLEAGMIGLNTGNASATEAPFGGIKDSGVGKESGKDVAVNEFLITKTGTLSVEDHY